MQNNESTDPIIGADQNFETNLLENGIDFILKGIDELFEEDELIFWEPNPVDATRLSMGNYKYGILNLFSGFLLLLKERLHRHMPELVFCGRIADIREKLSKGRIPNTVDLDTALERLEIGPRVVFPDDDLSTIRCMQDKRNKLEHYKGEFNKYQLWDTIAKFLRIIDRFLVEELEVRLEEEAKGSHLVEKINRIEAVWERKRREHEAAYNEELAEKRRQFEANREKVLAELYAEAYEMKGACIQFINCPQCYDETLIVEGEYAGICSNKKCDCTVELTECARCGEITVGTQYDSFPLCDGCEAFFSEQMAD